MQRREPVGVHRALHVSLEHTDAHARELGHHALEQRRLPAPGGAHEVHDAHARAVEVVPVRPRDRVVRVECLLDDPHLCAMHSSSSTTIDSTSNSLPVATPTRPPSPHAGQREHREVHLPLAPAGRAAQPRRDELLLEPRALADRALRDEPEVEVEGLRDHLPQRSDAHRHDLTCRPAACFSTVSTIAPDSDSSCTSVPAYAASACSSLDRARPPDRRRRPPRAPLPRSVPSRSPRPRRARRRRPRPCRATRHVRTKRRTVCGSIP